MAFLCKFLRSLFYFNNLIQTNLKNQNTFNKFFHYTFYLIFLNYLFCFKKYFDSIKFDFREKIFKP